MTEVRYIEPPPQTIEAYRALIERLSWGKQYEIMLGVNADTALMLLDSADELASSRVMTIEQARRAVMRQALRVVNALPAAPGLLGVCR